MFGGVCVVNGVCFGVFVWGVLGGVDILVWGVKERCLFLGCLGVF